MDYYNDLDYYLDNSGVNMFAPGGRKKQGRRQNYVERAPGAVSDYTRAATAQFMSQYADVGKIQENTRKAVEKANAQRKSIAEDRMMKKGDFVKKHTDSLVKSAPKSSRASIKARQQQLKDMGLYKGKIDGKWGPLSIEAHNAAISGGAAWTGDNYVMITPHVKTEEASMIPTFSDDAEPLGGNTKVGNPNYSQFTLLKEGPSSIGEAWLGAHFPALRQVYSTLLGNNSGNVQTNRDFSDSYLDELAQLGQVAFGQYRRSNKQPKPGEVFGLSLPASAFKEVNPDGRYANFSGHGLLRMANALIGNGNQVEYTNGQTSGRAVIGEDGNVHWFPTDNSSFAFDPGQEETLAKSIAEKNIKGAKLGPIAGTIYAGITSAGQALRYALGKRQESLDKNGYENPKQVFEIVFPADTINVNPARYSNIPVYKQKK